MSASLKFTVWTIVVFSCIFEISQAQCNGTSCDSSVLFNTTTTTVNVLNCNLSESLNHSNSISNLEPGTVQTVFADCFNCCLNATTKPQIIQNLSVLNVTTSSMTVTWTEPEGDSSSYIVQWIDKSTPMNRTVFDKSTVITNLTAGVEYTVTVTAVAGDNKTIGAGTDVTHYTQPQVVKNLNVLNVTTSSMTVTWTEPEGNSSSYIVQWTDKSTPMNRTVFDKSTVITDLTAGVEYTVTVTAVAGDNETIGAGTDVTRYTQPQVVKNLNVLNVTTSSMTVTWTEPEGNSSSYIVQWTDKSTPMNRTVFDKSTVITDLTAGVEYTVTVTAVAGDNETIGAGTDVTRYSQPQVVKNLDVHNVTTSSMTVTWTEPEGDSSSYIVQWIDKSTPMNRTVFDKSTVITDLTAGVEYTVTVTAVAGDNETIGAGTDVTRYTQPQVVKNLNVLNVTTSSMTVTWTEPEGNSSSYIVQWTDKSTPMNRTVFDKSTVITDLTAGVEYTVTVTAVAGDNETIGAGTDVTRYSQPQVVKNLDVHNVTTSSMTVTWTEPEGDSSSYIVQWIDKSTPMNRTVFDKSTVITDLTAGVAYIVTVTAVAGDNKTIGAGTDVTRYTQPQVVKNLNVLNVTTSSMTVTWTEPEGNSSSYIVQWIDKSTPMNRTVFDKSTVITDLTAGVEYTVTVTAVAGDNETIGAGTDVTRYTQPQVVKNLDVHNVTTSSMTVTWTEPEGDSSSYIVQWIDKSTPMNRTVFDKSTVITYLTAGVEYTVTVTAVAGDNETIGAGTDVTRYTQPQVVKNLNVLNVTTSSMTVTWTEPEGNSSSYIVQWIDKSTPMNRTVFDKSTVITDLTAGVEYTVTVTAVAGDNETIGAGTDVTRYTQPQVVTNLDVHNVTTSSMTVTWTEPEGNSSSYIVQWIDKSTPMNRTVFDKSTVITDLTAGVEYTVTVTAVAGDNKTIGAGIDVTRYTQPQVVTNLDMHNVTTSSMTVTWTEPEGNSSSYIVQWIDKSTPMNRILFDKSTVITDLTAGVEYTVTVTAVAGDNETIGAGTDVTRYTQPQVVKNLNVLNVTTSSMTVTWTEPEGNSSSYIVQWIDKSTPMNRTVFDKSTVITDLTAGVEYTVTVTAVAGDNETIGAGTDVTRYTQPQVVTNLDVYNVTTSSMTVTWTEPEGNNSSYIVQWTDKSTPMNRTVFDKSTVITDLTAGVEYTVTVTAVAGDNKTIGAGTDVTRYTQPQVVKNLHVHNVTTSSMTVTWTEPEGNSSSYIVQWTDKSTPMNRTVFDKSTVITDLTAGVEYTVTVTAVAGDNKTIGAGTDVTCYTQPQVVKNPHVHNVTTSSMTVTWTEPEGNSSSYIVQWTDKSTPMNRTVFDKSTVITDLIAGVEYTVTVTAVAGDNKTIGAGTDVTRYTQPQVVKNLHVHNVTTSSMTVTWTEPEGNSSSYIVQWTDKSTPMNRTVFDKSTVITDLTAGVEYTVTVTAVAGDNETIGAGTDVTRYTRPYGINALAADTINTTSINVTWKQPVEYQEGYEYLVKTSGCSDPKNLTISNESVEIPGLTPGTNCSFCVTVRAANGIEGESKCTSQYTKPEKAQPHVSNQGSNSSLLVSWAKPPGNVEMYTVYLNDTETNLTMVKLNSSGRFHTFEGLPAGRLYTVVVETQSGSFSVPSESITNATYPNPPGAISILNKTTGSIHISWEEAPLMTGAHFYYRLEISSGQVKNTTATNDTFDDLKSGTPYNVSVVTVAAMGFESEAVWHNMVTTRPFSVQDLQADPSEDNVTLRWTKPKEYNDTYRFRVALVNSSGHISRLETTTNFTQGFSLLDPGSSYDFTVTTQTSDCTQGAPEKISICTDASAVEFSECSAPNEPNAKITWFWKKPRGHFSNFTVKLGDSAKEVREGFKYEKSNLKHYTNYTVEVTTQSCGKPSVTVNMTCQTGITNPPISQNYDFQIRKECNMFTITMNSGLLDTSNGPITNVGVLLTRNTNAGKACPQNLKTTYDQWKKEKTGAYLATVIDITDSDVKVNTRSTPDPLTIHVGDETKWNDYENGVLEPTKRYKFAIVLFTDLKIKSGLINVEESLFSPTDFQGYVELPQNPVVIGLAVGLTLAIFLILLILLIGFIIYWRRLSCKKSSDVQVKCKRIAPVRVEDYEVYYKKQKADSNCGFAAEYEDLKVVGVGLSKTNATNPEIKSKNRYNNVLPYDSSRVKLSIINGNPLDDYINANYIPGYNSRKEFIAAQGPLPTTVNDFWRMIWEKNVHAIVMLTRCNEQGRVKCEQYWTPGTKHFGNITVTKTSEIPLDDWTIRDFDVKNIKTAETRLVRQFHFTAWPDHGVPETTELLISFRHLVREHMDQYRHSPTVVHCSAGVGRTGTFIAIDRLIFQIERENVVDVYGIVYDMRMHRVLMVQTEDQYVFLNQCALDIIRSRTGTNVDLIYQNMTAVPIYENIELQKRES